MAYSFDRTMSALGQLPGQTDPDSSQNQSNVLAPSPQGSQNFSATIPTDTVTASSTAGDIGASQATSSGAARSPDSPNVSNTTANNSLMAKNQGRVGSPVDVQGIQNNIAGAKTGLQNEANSYIAGAGDLYGGGKVSDAYTGQINQFVKNGADPNQQAEPIPQDAALSGFDAYAAQNKANTAGSVQQSQPYAFTDLYKMGQTQVNPLAIQTNTNFQQANDLGTDAGLRNLFRQGNDAEYTSGQAAIDQNLLTRTPGFNEARDKVSQANADLQGYKNDVTANAQNYAQQARDAAQKSWKAAVTDQLNTGMAGIMNGGKTAADNFITQLGLVNKADIANKGATAAGFQGAWDPAAGAVTGASGVDPTAYVKQTIDPSTVNWSQFLNADQARAYDAINGLEGNGTAVLGGAGKYAGTTNADGSVTPYAASNGYTFDDAGYRAAAADAATQRMKDAQAAAAAQAAAQTKAENNSPFANGTYTDNASGPYNAADPYGKLPGDVPIPGYQPGQSTDDVANALGALNKGLKNPVGATYDQTNNAIATLRNPLKPRFL